MQASIKKPAGANGGPLISVQFCGLNASDNIQIQAARKAFAGRLSRKLGMTCTTARLSVEMMLGGVQ